MIVTLKNADKRVQLLLLTVCRCAICAQAMTAVSSRHAQGVIAVPQTAQVQEGGLAQKGPVAMAPIESSLPARCSPELPCPVGLALQHQLWAAVYDAPSPAAAVDSVTAQAAAFLTQHALVQH